MKLGLITSSADPSLHSDDLHLLPYLKNLGIDPSPFIWDERNDFTSCDAFVFRSCWNYHRKFDQFLDWLTRLENSDARVLNPVPVSRWNLHKKYLLEVPVPIPATTLIPRGESFREEHLPAGEMIVVKPAISLSGHETFLRQRTDTNKIREDIALITRDRDVLIQEYIPEITDGEISLVYFAGELSHAIRKVPAAGEFRIHQEYGGTRLPYDPDENLLKEMRPLIDSKPGLLYSRVDIVITGASWKLIEWEIIDPSLYLGSAPKAAERFALAIQRALTQDLV